MKDLEENTKMKNIFIMTTVITCFNLITINCVGQHTKPDKLVMNYPDALIDIAHSIGMEPIAGDAFGRPEIYGGQGLPYVFGVVTRPDEGSNRTPASVLFWCQKGEKKYLVFATKEFTNGKNTGFEVKDIISTSKLYGHDYDIEGSYGLIWYDGIFGIDKDLSHFISLDNRNKKGPEGIFPLSINGSNPIIIYEESAVQVLYLYKQKWYEYTRVDW